LKTNLFFLITTTTGREVVFQCRDEGPLRARVKWTRRGRSLPPGTKDTNGRLEIPDIKLEHGGEYVCEAVGYSNLPHGTVAVHLNVEACEFLMTFLKFVVISIIMTNHGNACSEDAEKVSEKTSENSFWHCSTY
jgi:hypothetical protein